MPGFRTGYRRQPGVPSVRATGSHRRQVARRHARSNFIPGIRIDKGDGHVRDADVVWPIGDGDSLSIRRPACRLNVSQVSQPAQKRSIPHDRGYISRSVVARRKGNPRAVWRPGQMPYRVRGARNDLLLSSPVGIEDAKRRIAIVPAEAGLGGPNRSLIPHATTPNGVFYL